MKLAYKEILHQKKKYLLVEVLLILMVFMVLFLSGLASGLGRAVSSGIDIMDASSFILSEDSQELITVSNITPEDANQIVSNQKEPAAMLNIQRTFMQIEEEGDKYDITYFAIEPDHFLMPRVIEGGENGLGQDEIILDDAFKADGISLGDTILDAGTGRALTVTAFTTDASYGHVPIGYINYDTYNAIRQEQYPSFGAVIQTIAIQGDATDIDADAGFMVMDKQSLIESIPGYSAEQTTIQMILWVLVVASSAILGVFFYILTLQKRRQFAMMKAIGVSMGQLTVMLLSQVVILALFGTIVGNILAFAMASALPEAMPFYLNIESALIVSVAFISISVFASLISTIKVARIDPIDIIGGNEA